MESSKESRVGLFWIALACVLSLTARANVPLTEALGNGPPIPSAPKLQATGYLLIDATNGEVLVEHNADQPLPPASLTKMMTAYIAEREIAAGRISFDDKVPVSIKAWKTGGSRMFIREGTEVRLEDLLRGIVIQSGNDASVAVAEYIAGSEDVFADVMNQTAVSLGMTGTQFKNSTGLPQEGHYSTAKDLGNWRLAPSRISQRPMRFIKKNFTITALGRRTETACYSVIKCRWVKDRAH